MAPQYFNGKPQNIGLHLGDKYGSADVDCDCPEAIVAARESAPGNRPDIREAIETVLAFLLPIRSAGPHRAVSSIRWTTHACRAARVVIGWHDRLANSGPAKHPRDWRGGPIRAGLRRHARKYRCGGASVGGSQGGGRGAPGAPLADERIAASCVLGSGRRARARWMERRRCQGVSPRDLPVSLASKSRTGRRRYRSAIHVREALGQRGDHRRADADRPS